MQHGLNKLRGATRIADSLELLGYTVLDRHSGLQGQHDRLALDERREANRTHHALDRYHRRRVELAERLAVGAHHRRAFLAFLTLAACALRASSTRGSIRGPPPRGKCNDMPSLAPDRTSVPS